MDGPLSGESSTRRALLSALVVGAMAVPALAQVERDNGEGDYEITVFGSRGDDTGSLGSPGDVLLQSKLEASQLADELAAGGVILVVIGCIAMEVGGAGLVAAGGFAFFIALWLKAYANDPPRSDFDKRDFVDMLNVVLPTPVASGHPDLVRLVRCGNSLVPLSRSMLDAVERLHGAEQAHDAAWVSHHQLSHDLVVATLCTRARQMAKAFNRLAATDPSFRRAYRPAELKANIAKLATPAKAKAFRDGLTAMGISDASVDALLNAVARLDTSKVRPGTLRALCRQLASALTKRAGRLEAIWYAA